MPSIKTLKAFNFQGWIDANREKFKPPVGNAQVWEDGDLMVTVVGGPNSRNDYHDDPTEEFFYQLKGDIFLHVMPEEGKPPVEIPIKEGDVPRRCSTSGCRSRYGRGEDHRLTKDHRTTGRCDEHRGRGVGLLNRRGARRGGSAAGHITGRADIIERDAHGEVPLRAIRMATEHAEGVVCARGDCRRRRGAITPIDGSREIVHRGVRIIVGEGRDKKIAERNSPTCGDRHTLRAELRIDDGAIHRGARNADAAGDAETVGQRPRHDRLEKFRRPGSGGGSGL